MARNFSTLDRLARDADRLYKAAHKHHQRNQTITAEAYYAAAGILWRPAGFPSVASTVERLARRLAENNSRPD